MSTSDEGPSVSADQVSGLSARDRAILDLSKRSHRTAQAHSDAVRAELGMSITDYLRELNRLIDDPAALAYSPIAVNRMRRNRHTSGP